MSRQHRQRKKNAATPQNNHNSGTIDYSDFEAAMAAKIRARDPDEEIAKAFALFDESGRGKIGLRELRRVARDLGEPLADEELQEMVDEADRDGDGEVDLDEFRRVSSIARATWQRVLFLPAGETPARALNSRPPPPTTTTTNAPLLEKKTTDHEKDGAVLITKERVRVNKHTQPQGIPRQ